MLVFAEIKWVHYRRAHAQYRYTLRFSISNCLLHHRMMERC